MENQLKLKIKIGQVEFEAEGDTHAVTEQRDFFVQSIVPAASSFLDKIQSIETARVAESSTNSQIVQNETAAPALPYSNASDNIDWSRTSLVTFLKKYGELGEQDFVLFSAYYHEKRTSPSPFVFNVDDVKKFYGEARRSAYGNNSLLLNRLAKAGFIIDAPDVEKISPKPYVISQDGLTYVESYVPKEKSEKKIRKSQPSRKKVESIYASLNADELNLSKYPAIKDLKTSKEQIILAMYILTIEKNCEWFKNSDIEYIMPNLFDVRVTRDMVSNAFRQKSWFDTRKAEDDSKSLTHRLMAQAKDFAKKIIAESKE